MHARADYQDTENKKLKHVALEVHFTVRLLKAARNIKAGCLASYTVLANSDSNLPEDIKRGQEGHSSWHWRKNKPTWWSTWTSIFSKKTALDDSGVMFEYEPSVKEVTRYNSWIEFDTQWQAHRQALQNKTNNADTNQALPDAFDKNYQKTMIKWEEVVRDLGLVEKHEYEDSRSLIALLKTEYEHIEKMSEEKETNREEKKKAHAEELERHTQAAATQMDESEDVTVSVATWALEYQSLMRTGTFRSDGH